MRRRAGVRWRGFTLIELMVVVAIIGLLAAIAVPKFADLIRKSNEGQQKGNLGTLRSILSIYYGDNEGQFPQGPKAINSTVLSDALIPKYLSAIPPCRIPDYHPTVTTVGNHEMGPGPGYPHIHEGAYGCWVYDGVNQGSFGFAVPDSNWGTVWLDCSHTDTKGSYWSTY